MQIHRFVMPMVILGSLSLGVVSAYAQTPGKSTTTTTTTVITTAAPAPKETVAAPEGYSSCTTVAAGWRNTVWHPEYKVCRYDTKNTTVEGEAWVAGHWECSQYTVGAEKSECSNWDWASGRWVKTYAELQ